MERAGGLMDQDLHGEQKDMMKEHGLRPITIPARSPDMNRVERPFGEMERRVIQKYRVEGAPATEARFISDIREVFTGMHVYMRNQAEKMPEVARDVIANGGGPTRH